MVHGRLDSVRHALDIGRREIGMHRQAENTSGGALCVGKAAFAGLRLWASKYRLLMQRDRIVHRGGDSGIAHGGLDGFAVVNFYRVLRPRAGAVGSKPGCVHRILKQR